MATYDLGDEVKLSTTVTDDDGTALAATMTLTVTDPAGTDTTPDVTTDTGTGNYSATLTPDAAGTWFYTWAASGTVVAVESGQFAVLDPVPPTYASLADMKRRLPGNNATDDELVAALRAASRRIDNDTGRRFWRDKTASARIYEITHPEILVVDDIAAATGVTVEVGHDPTFSSVPATLWRLQPDASFVKQKPAYAIRRRPYAPWRCGGQAKVTAVWGWPLVPDDVHEACLLLAGRLYSRKESITGLAGFNDLGPVRISRTDSDYDALVSSYVRPEV